ncbi:MAG: SlyX family protein [Panacagrimonas sp.]
MNEPRLDELESRFAYADEALRVLSDTVARQQKQIDYLELLCRQLLERAKAQGNEVFKGTAADEIPPHY